MQIYLNGIIARVIQITMVPPSLCQSWNHPSSCLYILDHIFSEGEEDQVGLIWK